MKFTVAPELDLVRSNYCIFWYYNTILVFYYTVRFRVRFRVLTVTTVYAHNSVIHITVIYYKSVITVYFGKKIYSSYCERDPNRLI